MLIEVPRVKRFLVTILSSPWFLLLWLNEEVAKRVRSWPVLWNLARWLSSEPAAGIIIHSSLELRCREQTINSCSVTSRDPAYTQAALPSLYTSSDESLESSPRRDLTIAAVSRDTSEVFERCGMTKIKIVLSAPPPPFLSISLCVYPASERVDLGLWATLHAPVWACVHWMRQKKKER